MSNFFLILCNLGLMTFLVARTQRGCVGVVRMMSHFCMYDLIMHRRGAKINLAGIDLVIGSWSGREMRSRYGAHSACGCMLSLCSWGRWRCVRPSMMTFIRLFLDEFVIVLNMLVLNGLSSDYRINLLMLERRCLQACGSCMLMVLDFLVTDRCTIKALSNGVTRSCHV